MAIVKFDEEFLYGGQPTLKDLNELASQGCRSIVNVRKDGESDQPLSPKDEGIEVQEFGMDYSHLPFSYKGLNIEDFKKYLKKMAELPKPLYIHCQAGRRAGIMLAIFYAHKHGLTGDQMMPLLNKFGLANEGSEIREFIKEKVDLLKDK